MVSSDEPACIGTTAASASGATDRVPGNAEAGLQQEILLVVGLLDFQAAISISASNCSLGRRSPGELALGFLDHSRRSAFFHGCSGR